VGALPKNTGFKWISKGFCLSKPVLCVEELFNENSHEDEEAVCVNSACAVLEGTRVNKDYFKLGFLVM
jgi:hypothetical protein